MARYYISIFKEFRIILSSYVNILLTYTHICVSDTLNAYYSQIIKVKGLISPQWCTVEFGITFVIVKQCVEKTPRVSKALKHCLSARTKIFQGKNFTVQN